ncbi:MAG: DNA-processing protein DprA [Peptoniphilaceae bacterium]|nr:DNA-processing protein DprA [Peptoniphilaceae bacterium]MDD7383145.1 DNA-processing protein DprA [Peptoniphilaceae bacterium]MDY3738124.1 DNA-processing protein DprA [Peptoniphilaceae bacterium]
MNKKITIKEVLTYLNFLKISNRKILSLFKHIDLDKIYEIDFNKFEIVDKKTKEKIFNKDNIEKFKRYVDRLKNGKYKIVSIYDDYYPRNLRYIDDPPAILYYMGELNKNDEYSLSFVGSRKCSDYGKWACKELTSQVVSKGITTVSGLASGIDSICHKTTIENNGRTIAILGNGINIIYPSKNRVLYEEIINKGGLILSEFPLDTTPKPYNFPRRNRIISGISLGTVVIEAKEKSGSLITASYASEQGKEVFSIPGNINSVYSKGTNKLIQDGCKLILNVDDILEEIEILKEKSLEKEKDNVKLDEIEMKIYKYIQENGPSKIDDLVLNLGEDINTINFVITSLELKDYISNSGILGYVVKG